MGAWDSKNFGNDQALDWVSEFVESTAKLKRLEKTLRDALQDNELGEEGLAAAEVVAALGGHPATDLPEEIANWVSRSKTHPAPALFELALKALESIQQNSELDSLWKESPTYAEWLEVLKELQQRLTQKPSPIQKPVRVVRTPMPACLYLTQLDGGIRSSNLLKFRLDGLPNLLATYKHERIDQVDIELGYDFTLSEFVQISTWLACKPNIGIYFSDLQRTKGFKLSNEVLQLFHRAQALDLYLETAKNLEFLGFYKNLQKLHLLKLHKTCDLLSIPSSSNVTSLGLSSFLKLNSLQLLKAFPNLTRLEINGFELIQDYAELLALNNLQTLIVSGFNKLATSFPLEKLSSLRHLSCAPKSAEELKTYMRLPQLQVIAIWLYDDFQVQDFDCFRNHPTLRAINISGFGWKEHLKAVTQRLGFKEADPSTW